MIRLILAYLGAGIAMAGLDVIWLTQAAGLYRPALDAVLLPQGFRLAPAAAFYLLYLLGIVIFAVRPALQSGRWRTAALFGGLYGLFCYTTYDLTNQATLAVWPVRIMLIDIAWGVVLTTVSALAGFAAARVLRPKS